MVITFSYSYHIKILIPLVVAMVLVTETQDLRLCLSLSCSLPPLSWKSRYFPVPHGHSWHCQKVDRKFWVHVDTWSTNDHWEWWTTTWRHFEDVYCHHHAKEREVTMLDHYGNYLTKTVTIKLHWHYHYTTILWKTKHVSSRTTIYVYIYIYCYIYVHWYIEQSSPVVIGMKWDSRQTITISYIPIIFHPSHVWSYHLYTITIILYHFCTTIEPIIWK